MSAPADRLRAVMDAAIDGERPRPLPSSILTHEFAAICRDGGTKPQDAAITYRGRVWIYDWGRGTVSVRKILSLDPLKPAITVWQAHQDERPPPEDGEYDQE